MEVGAATLPPKKVRFGGSKKTPCRSATGEEGRILELEIGRYGEGYDGLWKIVALSAETRK